MLPVKMLASSSDFRGNPAACQVKLTPERLLSLRRISNPQVSPDSKTLLFVAKDVSIKENAIQSSLYQMGISGSKLRQITPESYQASQSRWRPDGNRIGFIRDKQIWEIDPDGSNPRQITHFQGEITGFAYCPNMEKLFFTAKVKKKKAGKHLFKDLNKTEAVISDDLMYRHWDQWVEEYSHILIADYSPKGIKNPVDIMAHEPWEAPLRPFGGLEQITWSPDGKIIAYTARKKTGLDYALSTDSNIWLYNLETMQTQNLTPQNPGYDKNPAFSPDGRQIAWLRMPSKAYEADRKRLMVHDLSSGRTKELTADWDRDVTEFIWSADGKSMYFICPWQATSQIYHLDLKTKKITQVTHGRNTYSNITLAGKELIAKRCSLSEPPDIFSVNTENGRPENLSRLNQKALSKFCLGQVSQRWIKTTDQKKMLTLLIKPPDFDPHKKYPALLYCEGGPEVPLTHYWSWRWNLQTFAAQGYIIVAPCRRGTIGFGQDWKKDVLKDWGGQPMRDLLSAIDSMSREPWVDQERLAAIGPSFGGFSVYWLAGHHQERFKAFVAHDGPFNLKGMYLQTDELWFMNSELGGEYWKEENGTTPKSYNASPHNFISRWDTPILIIHGQRDYRVPLSQGISAFNAARLKGLKARFLYFPDEGHWVLKPQNSLLWYRTIIDWLGEMLN